METENIFDVDKLWRKALVEIELLVSRANFVTWFQNTKINYLKDGVIFLNVPNSFAKEWIQKKYDKFILKSLRRIDPSIRSIDYIIHSNPIDTERRAPIKQVFKKTEDTQDTQLEFTEFYETKDSLNPKYVFDNFIIGSFNELAHAAAIAVTKKLGLAYNPLFIYGGVGLGKTHLLQAIGNEIKKQNQNTRIKYTTTERFTNEYIQSLKTNRMYEFKNNYIQYDLLIIDDIQFLAKKTKTQEEFFHVFNALYENNKQIILSSDRSPKSIPDLEERLRSRFEGGMMADVSEPEYESRVAILSSKAQEKNFDLSKEAIDYIASSIKNNIRELEGFLNILLAQSRLLNRSLSINEIEDLFKKTSTKSKKKVTFNQIIKTISDFYEIKEQNIFEKSRKKEFVLPRQVAMYILRKDFNGSYPYIGQKFGGKDHTTVMHACEKISKDNKNDQKLKNDIQMIRDCLYK
ncbi:chromosomal replication initiator protein DnaA [Patescibacteria group bacterium]|nr:chromosomal replication initiator protein DnaA [Patescibacteria group bacterium]MBU2633335.1 chromosomal replication initiator protein DnaA [Patescibacteria group bacterium]